VVARPSRSRSVRRRRVVLRSALVAMALVVVGVGLVVVRTQLRAQLVNDGAQSVNPNDAYGISHVHGLGVNPADDSLIVATHNGSFRLPAGDDTAVRIGDSLQDTMGFTVVGPDHFLGSGHPDLAGRRAGQPNQLGLIESTDGGSAWSAIALGGEVDFHGLAASGGRTYGWDSGTRRFMMSTDQREWETRSTLDLFGFDVDPADPDHLVAAGPQRLVESFDGGRTWAAAVGPLLVAISWDQTAGLWGVGASGDVHRRERSGWTYVGALPGDVQAVLATPDALYAAASDVDSRTGIYRSVDAGETWELRYRDPEP